MLQPLLKFSVFQGLQCPGQTIEFTFFLFLLLAADVQVPSEPFETFNMASFLSNKSL